MTNTLRLTVSTIALFAGLSVASAQTTPPADPHHPATTAPGGTSAPAAAGATAPTPGQMPGPGMGGMMGSGGMGQMMGGGMDHMMPMMRMMRAMMAAHTGQMGRMNMMPTEHVEGRIAFLKAELGITEAQLPKWNSSRPSCVRGRRPCGERWRRRRRPVRQRRCRLGSMPWSP